MSEETIEQRLRRIAAQKCSSDDEHFSVYDYSGGNYDDAYSIGTDHGEIWFARHLLKLYFSNGERADE